MSEDMETIGEADLVEGLERKKFSGKKMILFGGAGVVVLIIIGVVVSMLMGGEEEPVDPLDELGEEVAAKNKEAEAAANVKPEELSLHFIDVNPGTINLVTGGQGTSYLNAEFVLQVDRESFKVAVEERMPLILNDFVVYLKELRPADLEGARGVERVRQELLRRINQTLAPVRVQAVLMQNFVITGASS